MLCSIVGIKYDFILKYLLAQLNRNPEVGAGTGRGHAPKANRKWTTVRSSERVATFITLSPLALCGCGRLPVYFLFQRFPVCCVRKSLTTFPDAFADLVSVRVPEDASGCVGWTFKQGNHISTLRDILLSSFHKYATQPMPPLTPFNASLQDRVPSHRVLSSNYTKDPGATLGGLFTVF